MTVFFASTNILFFFSRRRTSTFPAHRRRVCASACCVMLLRRIVDGTPVLPVERMGFVEKQRTKTSTSGRIAKNMALCVCERKNEVWLGNRRISRQNLLIYMMSLWTDLSRIAADADTRRQIRAYQGRYRRTGFSLGLMGKQMTNSLQCNILVAEISVGIFMKLIIWLFRDDETTFQCKTKCGSDGRDSLNTTVPAAGSKVP